VDQVLSDERAGDLVWSLADHQGSVRDIIDASGNPINQITYSAFGEVINETAPATSFLFGYTGAVFDIETGLGYHRARYLDHATGRWLSEDPIGFEGDASNVYRYAENAPTNGTDPTGLDFIALGSRRVSLTWFHHYSLEYWSSDCAAPSATSDGIRPSDVPRLNGDPDAYRVTGVELIATSPWRAWYTSSAGKHRTTVRIAYIQKISTATRIVPLRDGVGVADWLNVLAFADAYGYAEHPPGRGTQGPTPPLQNWPESAYAVFGTNSNVFIRWLVGATGMTMVEMTGSHPPDRSRLPQQNPPAAGTWLRNPSPTPL
jgi:RHS repeat-associated protein